MTLDRDSILWCWNGRHARSLLPVEGRSYVDFARSGSAYCLTPRGIYSKVPAATPRFEVLKSRGFRRPLLLNEPARTNLLTRATDFSAAAWSTSGSFAESDVESIFGGESARLIEKTGGAGDAHFTQQRTLADPAEPETASAVLQSFMPEGSGLKSRVTFSDHVAGVTVADAEYDWDTDSIFSNGSGSDIEAVRLWRRGDLVRIAATGTPANGGANTNIFVRPVENASNDGHQAAVHHAQFEHGGYASSPIITAGSAASRVADRFRWRGGLPLWEGGFTVYWSGRVPGQDDFDGGIWRFGADNSEFPYFRALMFSDGRIEPRYQNGGGETYNGGAPNITADPGDTVEILTVLRSDTSLLNIVIVNGTADSSGSNGTGASFPSGRPEVLQLGSLQSGAAQYAAHHEQLVTLRTSDLVSAVDGNDNDNLIDEVRTFADRITNTGRVPS